MRTSLPGPVLTTCMVADNKQLFDLAAILVNNEAYDWERESKKARICLTQYCTRSHVELTRHPNDENTAESIENREAIDGVRITATKGVRMYSRENKSIPKLTGTSMLLMQMVCSTFGQEEAEGDKPDLIYKLARSVRKSLFDGNFIDCTLLRDIFRGVWQRMNPNSKESVCTLACVLGMSLSLMKQTHIGINYVPEVLKETYGGDIY